MGGPWGVPTAPASWRVKPRVSGQNASPPSPPKQTKTGYVLTSFLSQTWQVERGDTDPPLGLGALIVLQAGDPVTPGCSLAFWLAKGSQ